MSNEPGTSPDVDTEGHPEGTPEGATRQDPPGDSGHASGQGSADPGTPPAPTGPGTPGADDDAFFDRKTYQALLDKLEGNEELSELRDQVLAYEKSLQGAYTKKTQEISSLRKKAEMVDQFEARARQVGPAAALADLARVYNVSPEAMAQNLGGDNSQGGLKDSYDSIDEFASDLERRIEARIQKHIEPLMSKFQELSVQQVEAKLNAIDPDWKIYEDQMAEVANRHPSLMKDPAALYRMAVPQEVQEKRAVKAALAKLEKQSKSASVSGTGTSTSTATPPKRAGTFSEAAQGAIDQLKKEGRFYT